MLRVARQPAYIYYMRAFVPTLVKVAALLLAGWLLGSCCHRHEDQATADRTVLMYMSANNDLYYDALRDIRSVLSSCDRSVLGKKGQLLVFFSGPTDRSPGGQRLLRINPSKDLKKQLADTVLLNAYSFDNPLDPAAMQQVMDDAVRLAPASHYGLIMWSHSTGWLPKNLEMTTGDARRAFRADELRTKWFGAEPKKSNGNEFNHMDFSELAEVMEPYGWEFLIGDACLCSSVELGYELRHAAGYLVGSPTEVLTEGFPYKRILPLLYSKNSPLEISQSVAACFIDFFQNDYYFNGHLCPYATIAVTDLSEMEALAAATQPLMAKMKKDSLSIQGVQVYDGRANTMFFDFDSFVRENLADPDSDPDYQRFKTQLQKAVPYSGHTNYFYSTASGSGRTIRVDDYCGLATYVPRKVSKDELIGKCNEAWPATAWAQAIGY